MPSVPRERNRLVQEAVRVLDHLGAAPGVVGTGPSGVAVVLDDVRPVERVVEAPPARVGRVEREPSVAQRDDQLGPRNVGDLVVDLANGDGLRAPVLLQVADLSQERLVGRERTGTLVRPMPRIEPLLELAPLNQQLGVGGPEHVDHLGQPRPEGVWPDRQRCQDIPLDESAQTAVDLQPVPFDVIRI